MRYLLTSILIMLAAYPANAQLGKLLKDKLKNVAEDVAEEVIDPEAQKAKLREQQLVKDTTSYNYALSQSDKAAFFETKDDNQSLVLGAIKRTDDETLGDLELTKYERSFDYNRKGSSLLYVNDLLAASNFWSGIMVYLDEEEEADALAGMLVTSLFSAENDRGEQLFAMMSAIADEDLELPDYYAVAKSVSNLSIFYHANGQYSLARSLLNSNLDFISATIGGGSLALAADLNNHAVVLKDQGEYTQAEKEFDKAEAILISRGEGSSLNHALLLNNRAMLFAAIGRYSEAESDLNTCIRIASEELNTKGADFSRFQINLGLVYQEQQNYDAAEKIYKDVLRLKEKRFGKRHEDYANVQNNLAALYMETGKTGEVESLLKNALEVYQAKLGDTHPAYAGTMRNLGKFYYYTDRYSDAKSTLESAKSIYEDNFGDLNPSYIEILGELALVSWQSGNPADATSLFDQNINKSLQLLAAYFPAMSENEKAKYWARLRPTLLNFYNYALDQNRPDLIKRVYELQLMTKGILLSSTTRVKFEILNSGDDDLISMYKAWTNIKEQLANYYTYSKEELSSQEIDLKALEEEANDLEKSLSENSAAFADASTIPEFAIADVQNKLKPGEAAIEIIRMPRFDKRLTDESQYAFLILKPGADGPTAVVLNNGNDLEGKFANAYRKQISFKTEDAYSFANFWAPVDDALVGITSIYLSPDGVYNQVNIATFQRPDGSYVLDGLNIHIVPSTRAIGRAFTGKSAQPIVMMGAPDYGTGGSVDPLPGTEVEVKAIDKMLSAAGRKTSVYLAGNASEGNLKSEVHAPNILHIATHGFFLKDVGQASSDNVFGISIEQAAENPLLRSGLLLANAADASRSTNEVGDSDDGILTAYEAMLMDLEGTDMVILSACETGLGEVKAGEGVYGLQRAFQVAGANSIIMSLWKVNDSATQQLMTTFYKNWLVSGDKKKAFADAQRTLKTQYPEPYYWGAFVMIN